MRFVGIFKKASHRSNIKSMDDVEIGRGMCHCREESPNSSPLCEDIQPHRYGCKNGAPRDWRLKTKIDIDQILINTIKSLKFNDDK